MFADTVACLSPVDLSRIALSCRAGAAITEDAAVWRRSCVTHYRFGGSAAHLAEVARQARQLAGGTEDVVSLCRAWRKVGAALWWYTDSSAPVEKVLRRLSFHRHCRVSVPVGFQGLHLFSSSLISVSLADSLVGCLRMHVCVCVFLYRNCVCGRMHAGVHMYAHAYVHACALTCTYPCKDMHRIGGDLMYACTPLRTCTCVRECPYIYQHACMHEHTLSFAHTCA